MSAQPMSKATRAHDILQQIAVVVLALGLIVGMSLPFAVPAQAAEVEEKEGERLIVGLIDVDANVRQEEEYEKRLAQAQREANLDALTDQKMYENKSDLKGGRLT